MQPIVDRFGFKVLREVDQPDFAEVVYTNDTTGLSAAVDWSEFRPFVHIHQLIDGQLPADPISYASNDQLKSFDIDDLLRLRANEGSPVGKMLGERDNAAARRLMDEYAKALEQHASDVLCGGFTVFAELDRVVKTRARGMKQKS